MARAADEQARAEVFSEANVWSTPIRDLGLALEGTTLEPLIARFEREIADAGLCRVRPRVYLSTEGGVPFQTVAIAIPFYLARRELTELHARRTGFVEGLSPEDILRYLRHELGHVVNYAYRLYDEAEWVDRFGAISQPYGDDYRPQPFSRRFVRHLPGWYAQKHPDEDWAETFAVWMTPGRDWRAEYAAWPEALAKLEYCDRAVAAIRDRDPVVTDDELDEDVGEIGYSVERFYADVGGSERALPPGLDGALRAIFDELPGVGDRSAGPLLLKLARDLPAEVYRWTGHFPEHTRALLLGMATRADEHGLAYDPSREREATLALTTFVTTLAMNHVREGSYFR